MALWLNIAHAASFLKNPKCKTRYKVSYLEVFIIKRVFQKELSAEFLYFLTDFYKNCDKVLICYFNS